jgi:hypothetical protein
MFDIFQWFLKIHENSWTKDILLSLTKEDESIIKFKSQRRELPSMWFCVSNFQNLRFLGLTNYFNKKNKRIKNQQNDHREAFSIVIFNQFLQN